MKPDKETAEEESASVTGDAIGDTAYSERFVLKIMLKLANLDTIKDEIQEKSFEDDLCTLWDMTAERDVVLFLQKHNMLNLLNFALPIIESPRIIEIIVGIVGNMCCQNEVVAVLLKMDSFLNLLLENIKTDDSLVLIQLLRLINSSLFLIDHEAVCIWMGLFKKIEYSSALYFILKNSSNKDLLVTALENINTICSYCNTEKCRGEFFTHFVTPDALESLTTAFTEITVNQKDKCEKDELERVLVISLQTILNLLGFDKSLDLFKDTRESVSNMIGIVLKYYEKRFVEHKEMDSDLIDIIDSSNTILNIMQINELSDCEIYFQPSYKIWKALKSVLQKDKNGGDNFEEEDKEELREFSKQLKSPLSTFICFYLAKCSENNLFKALDEIGADYEDILKMVKNKDKEIKDTVSKRAANYRTRLKESDDL
ncbi:protein saal1 [Aphomia sociella]